jgi:hypothetical protein
MAHHTKDKGDLGVAKAHADLVQRGFAVLVPLSEHVPFDLVAYRPHEFLRIQVKYRSAVDGVLTVAFRSSWADRHGSHERMVDKSEIDLYCVYCPETDACYYLRPEDYNRRVSLRISPSRNNQVAQVHLAEDFRRIP